MTPGAIRHIQRVAMVLAATLVLPGLVWTAAAQRPTPRVLVMPFENITHEARIVWLGEAAAVLLADNLNALGASAITREERLAAFERLQIPRATSLTDATVIRIGELVGAAQIVVGSLKFDNDTLTVRARTIALDAGRILSDQTEQGGIPDLFAIFQRVAGQIVPDGGGGPASAAPVNPNVLAFENYIKGLLAETPATASNYLDAALTAEPSFDRARLALWDVHAEQDEHTRALAAVSAVKGAKDLPRARFLTGLSQVALERYDAAFATFKELSEARPTAAVWNNLGVIQLRRGGTPHTGLATYYFTKAEEADPTEPDYCFNLGYTYWSERNMPAAIYWLREAVRRDPADGDAHYVLGAALAGNGSSTEAGREKELARRLSSTYAEWDKRPAAEQVPKRLERQRSGVELPRSSPIEASLTSSGQRDQRELARFYLDRARRLYDDEHDREAVAELNRVVFLSPYEAEAHLLIGRIHLRAGRTNDAVDALKISLWSADTAEAHAVLAAAYAAERETDLARTEAERALALDPTLVEARRVLGTLPPR